MREASRSEERDRGDRVDWGDWGSWRDWSAWSGERTVDLLASLAWDWAPTLRRLGLMSLIAATGIYLVSGFLIVTLIGGVLETPIESFEEWLGLVLLAIATPEPFDGIQRVAFGFADAGAALLLASVLAQIAALRWVEVRERA